MNASGSASATEVIPTWLTSGYLECGRCRTLRNAGLRAKGQGDTTPRPQSKCAPLAVGRADCCRCLPSRSRRRWSGQRVEVRSVASERRPGWQRQPDSRSLKSRRGLGSTTVWCAAGVGRSRGYRAVAGAAPGTSVRPRALSRSSDSAVRPKRTWTTRTDASWLVRGRSFPMGSAVQSSRRRQ
jgi:hypothetical protein